MSERLTRFIEDIRLFAEDLRSFLNPRTASAGLAHCLDDIRHDKERRTPLIFTVAVHIGALVFAIFGPMIVTFKHTIPEVYTVELYQAVEVPPPQVQKVVVRNKTETVKPLPPSPPPAVKPKAVSLSPIKQRLAREKEEREKEKLRQDLLKSRMEQVKLEFMKQQAEKEARQAASAAVDRISDLYRKEQKSSDAQKSATPTIQPPATGGNSSGTSMRELEALDRYKARLVQHIDKFWQLPELKEWSDNLECVMIIKVNRDGKIISSYFKKRSDDHRFNRYVQQAVENADPLPPFPVDLPQQSDEIHVTFYPGGLL